MAPRTNSRLRQVLKNVQKPQSGWLDLFPAVIGKSDGTILTGTNGLIHVRNILNGQDLTVYNFVVPNRLGLQVEVGRRVDQLGLWQVKGALETFDTPAGGTSVAYHAEQHRFRKPDEVPIDRKQITQLTVIVSDGPNFIVKVYGGTPPRTQADVTLIRNQFVDLSSYVPATGAIFISIEADGDGVLSVNEGTGFDAPAISAVSYIPAIDAGKYWVCSVLLFAEMEELKDEHIIVPFSGLVKEDGGAGADWGDIGGALSDQTDLQAALDSKLDDSQLEDAVNNGETTKAPTENAVFDALAAVVAATQPIDSDLTAIAGLSPANDDIIQRKAGAWTNRTLAQLITDLTELIQDIVGAMAAAGDQTGIAVTYDDTSGVIDFEVSDPYVDALVDDHIYDAGAWIPGRGTWAYVSADSPSFVMNIPDSEAAIITAGYRLKLVQTTTKYFIVTAKGTPSGGQTPVTIYGGTDYVLANAAITLPHFSPAKAPLDFPLDPSKWTVKITDSSNASHPSTCSAASSVVQNVQLP